MTKFAIVVTILVVMAGTVHADKIEVIQLQNRSADEMISIVGPLLKPDEAISGSGFKLILRASPETLGLVKRVLSQIDQGLKNLVISVRQGDAIRSGQTEGNIGARYHSETGGAVAGGIAQEQVQAQLHSAQRVRVLEGNPAYIHSGQILYSPGSTTHRGGIDGYGAVRQDTGTGFYALPRLHGNRVDLEVSPYLETLVGTGPVTDVQRLNTVISGGVGEWIYVGGIELEEQSRQTGILSGLSTTVHRQHGVYLKIEIAD